MAERGKVYNRIYNEVEWKEVNQENKDLLDDFLLELKSRKKKKSTIDQYFNDGRIIFIYILRHLKNKSILELTKKHFRNMSLWMMEDMGMSNSRSNRLMSFTRSLLDFAESEDDYDYDMNTASKVKGLPKEEVREIHFLKDDQFNLLREELRNRKDYVKMLLLDLAYDSAGRRNELAQVLKEGLLTKSNTNIVIGKRGKKFPLIYFSRTKESLKLYLEQRGEDDIESLWVTGKKSKREISYETIYDYFVSMADLLTELTGENIPFNPHSCRHSSLQNFSDGTHYALKEIGKDKMELNELMVYAHHSDISTTQSYLLDNANDMILQAFGIDIQ